MISREREIVSSLLFVLTIRGWFHQKGTARRTFAIKLAASSKNAPSSYVFRSRSFILAFNKA